MALVLLLLWVVRLAMAPPSHAQNSQQDYLNAHNVARGQVGVANFTWNNTVAAYAQNYANSSKADCNLVHSGGPYGENLAKGSGSFMAMAGSELNCGWRRSLITTTPPMLAQAESNAFTILKWFGKTPLGWGVIGFNPAICGGLLHATMIPQATTSGSVHIN